MSYDITTQEGREALAERIAKDIDDYCVKTYQQHFRAHLGASIIGHDCSRYIWSAFRWLKASTPSARMLRLFNRGHREEQRFIEFLRGIGFSVSDVSFDGNQHTISAVGKHFGGSLDSQLQAPFNYGISNEIIFLGECKTSGTGANFNDIRKKGVAAAKHQHFAQASVYGRKRGIKYAIYIVFNKNDDDFIVQVIELNWRLADELLARAEYIIAATEPPAKIAESRAFWKCASCDFVELCHESAPVEINCRSCKHATPIDNAKWNCALYGQIPDAYIAQGCGQHRSILDAK